MAKKAKKMKGKVSKKSAVKAKVAMKAAAKKPLPVPPKKAVLVSPKNSASHQFTQSELFESVRGSCGFHSRTDAKNFYAGFSGMIQSALKGGYKVVLPGLGKIQVRRTKARRGINPATQQPIMIPARRKVRFTPNKALKQAVL